MAATLECWSSRSTDEDMVEQVLLRTHDRSECLPENNYFSFSSSASSSTSSSSTATAASAFQKRFQRLSRNVSEAIASLKNTLNINSAHEPPATCRRQVWGSIVRSPTQLYPSSQLQDKLVLNLRKHYDSLPLSYAQAGFEMNNVFLHIKLIEQAAVEDNPAIIIQ